MEEYLMIYLFFGLNLCRNSAQIKMRIAFSEQKAFGMLLNVQKVLRANCRCAS